MSCTQSNIMGTKIGIFVEIYIMVVKKYLFDGKIIKIIMFLTLFDEYMYVYSILGLNISVYCTLMLHP